ncbi:hypothetical protein BD410DRAFT_788612 [Rickenella mellea]|uniref:HAD-superfamily phosphatase n=1 Tax=Rickenella mellea TaxID=50990 RepID=A0A4Y7Q566_9AGAM|nr:hypothetical protein BD410DRAFT_788612 [Rickenella mellea]
MPLNVSGVLAALQTLFKPRLILPSLTVNDIRQLDFHALKTAGFRGAVFDKDNCLTLPQRDHLVPELKDAWSECLSTFGPSNILVVSNSAGSRSDAGDIKAESVSISLGVPVLRHDALKPSHACIRDIMNYFFSSPSFTGQSPGKVDEEHGRKRPTADTNWDILKPLIVVGDRLFTDVILANRMRRLLNTNDPKGQISNDPDANSTSSTNDAGRTPDGPFAVYTTGVWKRESILMRFTEKALLRAVERWVIGEEEIKRRSEYSARFLRK